MISTLDTLEQALRLRCVALPAMRSRAAYLSALQAYSLSLSPQSWGMQMRVAIGDVMLCRLSVLNQCRPFTNTIWEEKIDGVRAVLCWHPAQGMRLFSRHVSVADYLPVELTGKFRFGPLALPAVPVLLDGELVAGDLRSTVAAISRGAGTAPVPARFHAFDALFYGEYWLLDRPLHERVGYIPASMRVPSVTREDYAAILARGGEGIVAKCADSVYVGGSRSQWIKYKRSVGDIDAFVVGGEMSAVRDGLAWLSFAVIDRHTGAERIIARISGLPDIVRCAPIPYYSVATITGYAVSSRVSRVEHARIIRWRPELDYFGCVW